MPGRSGDLVRGPRAACRPAGLTAPARSGRGWYIVQDVESNQDIDTQWRLSPAGGSTARNATIVQYYCDADPSRHWLVTPMGGGTYQIMNQHSGLCLSPAGGSTARYTTIVQYTCDGDPSRLWTMFGGPPKL